MSVPALDGVTIVEIFDDELAEIAEAATASSGVFTEHELHKLLVSHRFGSHLALVLHLSPADHVELSTVRMTAAQFLVRVLVLVSMRLEACMPVCLRLCALFASSCLRLRSCECAVCLRLHACICVAARSVDVFVYVCLISATPISK